MAISLLEQSFLFWIEDPLLLVAAAHAIALKIDACEEILSAFGSTPENIRSV
jgi:hypothetical protein